MVSPRWSVLLLLVACTQEVPWTPKDDTGPEGDADADTDADTDTDTDPEDLDDDGWTVAEGDCDDTDPWVHPGWDEDPDDGKDNDCDGRVDEAFWGVDVAYYNEDGGASIVSVDHLGRLDDEVALQDTEFFPLWLDHGLEGGWVVNNLYGSVETVTATGEASLLADFSKDDWGVYGVATHPDGWYAAVTIDDLWRVDPDGTVTSLASWSADASDPATFDLLAYTVAADPATGDLGLFGYYGGFATWTEADGFQVHRRADVEDWDGAFTYSGAHRDQGGWYSIKFDGYTGMVTIARFAFADASWTDVATWDEEWFPSVLTIDGDSGDFYVSANGGWYYAVWRILADGSYVTDLYLTDGTVPDRGFFGIAARY